MQSFLGVMGSPSHTVLNTTKLGHGPPISSLATETLSSILLLVAGSFPTELFKNATSLLQLGHVCRRWYAFILDEPRFWTSCTAKLGSAERFTRPSQDSDVPEQMKADQRRINALEAFYSHSGTILPLSITLDLQGPPTNLAMACRLATFLITKARRWTSISIESREIALNRQTSWIYPLMDLTKSELERLGSSPFENVDDLSLELSRHMHYRSGLQQSDVLHIDVTSLLLSPFFPNISTLSLELHGKTRALRTLRDNFHFKRLSFLKIRVEPGYDRPDWDTLNLEDLLEDLPALKHLDAWGLSVDDSDGGRITHPTLESFETNDERFHTEGSLSFPSLQILELGEWVDNDGPVDVPGLRTMLSATQLRKLVVGHSPIAEDELVQALQCVHVTLERLELVAPLGRWQDATGEVFTSLISSFEEPVTFPQLSEICVHAKRRAPQYQEWCFDDDEEYDGFCDFHDAFIKFVDDPCRWAPSSETSQLDHKIVREGYLEVAYFNYEYEVVYHREREVKKPLKYTTRDEF
ncbi:hypothetical protein BKA70DRAFT_1438343 [Coprinopsis sp. MPI-PUGE-AT-0042]|nr:hypothetical protein BKA70DRAFT_1438343 [Coprinopsis sp. MPI-PUGE-AT-0042]